MKGNRSLFIAVGVVAVLILGWWLFRQGRRVGGAVDLIERFEAAEKRPNAGVFAVEDVTLNGETKKSYRRRSVAGSRLIFKARIPDDGWLRVSVALKQEAWTQEGDGVRFLALVSDGRASDELFVQDVNPFANPDGPEVDPGDGRPVGLRRRRGRRHPQHLRQRAREGRDLRNDLAVWGAPEIVVR